LDALRFSLADGLGELPAVLALDPAEQSKEVAAGALSGLLTAEEVVAYAPMQFSERLRPFADSRGPHDPVLREHDAPFLAPPEG